MPILLAEFHLTSRGQRVRNQNGSDCSSFWLSSGMVQIARSSGSVPASSDDIPACDSRSQIVKQKWFILPVLLSEPHQTVAESILVFVFFFFFLQSWSGSMKPDLFKYSVLLT